MSARREPACACSRGRKESGRGSVPNPRVLGFSSLYDGFQSCYNAFYMTWLTDESSVLVVSSLQVSIRVYRAYGLRMFGT